jgi:hypothetical protein
VPTWHATGVRHITEEISWNEMTRVQIDFQLQHALDDELMKRIADAYSIYGIQKISLTPSQDGLMVEYDATRLRPAEVHAALMRAGIPATPK